MPRECFFVAELLCVFVCVCNVRLSCQVEKAASPLAGLEVLAARRLVRVEREDGIKDTVSAKPE